MAYRGYRTYPRSTIAFYALVAIIFILLAAQAVIGYLFFFTTPVNFYYAAVLAPLAIATATIGLLLLGNLERGSEGEH